MFSTGLILILAAYFATRNGECSLQVDHDLQSDDGELEWWQTAVFYQIYPRSFQDSDNDGLGDLQGIISRLDHLKDAGVTATWLSPIFSSPQVDQGYDISDYYSIDKIFGTMADLDELIAKAKELGIKIILDFVPNHTSDQHEWFKLSVNRTNGYEDFYVWRDAVNGSLPNNWISEFKGPAWTWNEERNQYYYHQFAPQQPDLNYSNPTVLKEMKKVITFWLDKGVDGFRMDAVPYLFEDAQFRDAPYARGYSSCDGDNVCLDITNVLKDLDGTYDVIYQFRELVDQYVEDNNLNESKVLMTEAYTTPENTMLYYGSSDGKRKGAHFSFNFNFISYLTGTDFSIDDISNAISKWLVYIPKGATNNWVLGNHDNHRVATRFGEDNVDGFNMLVAFLPGVMVTYNGEEIGMLDGEVTCEEGQDPSAIKNCSTFAENSRDFERTPFQWDNSTYAGFSNATPWLPVGSTKDWLNLAAQTEVTNVRSHFSIYKELLEFRQIFKKSSQVDELSTVKLSEEVLQIVRLRDNDEYIFLFNIGDSEQTVDFLRRANCHQVLVASVNSNQKKGNQVSKNVVLNGHESLILQNGAACSSSSRQLVSSVVPIVVLFSVVRYLISIMDKLFNLV